MTEENQVEKEVKEENLKHKHLKCPDCGIEVNLYGGADQNKCSACSGK